jgi:hypothetical protein
VNHVSVRRTLVNDQGDAGRRVEDGAADLANHHRGFGANACISKTIDANQARTVNWTTDDRMLLQKTNRQASPGQLSRRDAPNWSSSNNDNVSVHGRPPVPRDAPLRLQPILRRSQKILKPFCVVSA